MSKFKILPAIHFTGNDGITRAVSEGDKVLCSSGDNIVFVGTLSKIGTCKEDENAEESIAITIEDTYKILPNNQAVVAPLSYLTYLGKFDENDKDGQIILNKLKKYFSNR